MHNLVHPWQVPAEETSKLITNKKAVWTLVMPVFNQEIRVCEVLSKIHKNAAYCFNVVIVNDASDDRSLHEILKFRDGLKNKVGKFTVINNAVPIYETACDNQGFRFAETEYLIEIQSDIHVEEKDFDLKMIHAMNKLSLAAVSGRHVHSYSMLKGRRSWLTYPFQLFFWRVIGLGAPEGVGRLGMKIFEREIATEKNVCFIGETVARGPWLVRKSDLEKTNYLDEKNFFLGNDDHDYHRKMFAEWGKRVGYLPIHIYSISEDGATRKPRSGLNKNIYEYLNEHKKGSVEFNNFISNYRPYMNVKKEIL